MAETTPDQIAQPVVPVELTGTAHLAMLSNGDTYGHAAVVKWRGEEVTFTRSSSGRADEVVTTERDAVTENALLDMIVPGVRPPYDFRLMILADDCTGTWPGLLHLDVRGGKAEIVDRSSGESWPAHLPAWFLSALRDLVLVEREGEDA
jgi:hypothetical protein